MLWVMTTKIHSCLENLWFNQKLGGGLNPCEKYARQIGSFPQIGVKIKNIWNYHLVLVCFGWFVYPYHPIPIGSLGLVYLPTN